MVSRPHRMELRLSAHEAAALAAVARERGTSKADVLRAAIDAPVPARAPSRERVLDQLAAAADAGSVVAMTALARELRLGGEPRPAVHAPGPVDLAALAPGELRVVP